MSNSRGPQVDFEIVKEFAIDYTFRNVPLGYPHLLKPDTKFGFINFKTNVLLSKADAKELSKVCNDMRKDFIKKARPMLKPKAGKKHGPKMEKALKLLCDFSMKEEDDGRVAVSCKRNAVRKKDGQTIRVMLPVVDGKKQAIPKHVLIGGGSIANVKVTLWPWFSVLFGWGVQFKLSAVQIVKLEAPGNMAADSFEELDEAYAVASEGSVDFDDDDIDDATDAAGY